MNLRVAALLVLLLALAGGLVACGTTRSTTAVDDRTTAATTRSIPRTTPRRTVVYTVPRYVPPPAIRTYDLPRVTPSPGPTRTSAGRSGARPRSGAVVDARGARGRGEVEVDNGTARDGVLTLAQRGRTVRSVYVRAGDEARLTGVRDGAYDVFFTTGSGWDPGQKHFAGRPEYRRFPGMSTFSTTGSRYSVWTFSLHPVIGGDVRPEPVAQGEYPR